MNLKQTVVTVEAPEKIYPEQNIDTVEEPATEIDEKLTKQELIERYAQIQKLSIEEAEAQIGAPTAEEILKNIEKKTLEKIRSTQIPMNRAQRRALKKKVGSKKYAEMIAESGDITTAVSETAAKLNYISLIQKLRALNEKKENEKNGETIIEDD